MCLMIPCFIFIPGINSVYCSCFCGLVAFLILNIKKKHSHIKDPATFLNEIMAILMNKKARWFCSKTDNEERLNKYYSDGYGGIMGELSCKLNCLKDQKGKGYGLDGIKCCRDDWCDSWCD